MQVENLIFLLQNDKFNFGWVKTPTDSGKVPTDMGNL